MKIILLKEVRGLGRAGDVKDVSDGYALNFLLPKKLADVLTKGGLNTLESQKKKEEKIKKLEVKSKKKEIKKVNGRSFVITAKADETGTLYAKLDAKAIASELVKQGNKIEAGEIKLAEPIKKIGEYEAGLEARGESGRIKLEVRSEK